MAGGGLIVEAPAQAAPAQVADPCPVKVSTTSSKLEQPLPAGREVWAGATAPGGGLANFKGEMFCWPKGALTIWGEAYQNGHRVWQSDPPTTCYAATRCSFNNTINCGCFTGWVHL